MRIEDCQWETRFISQENIMSHKFTNKIEIKTNLKTGLITITTEDNEIEIDGSEMLITEYENLLLKISKIKI